MTDGSDKPNDQSTTQPDLEQQSNHPASPNHIIHPNKPLNNSVHNTQYVNSHRTYPEPDQSFSPQPTMPPTRIINDSYSKTTLPTQPSHPHSNASKTKHHREFQ
ncbi:hypothetical protein BO94DRAFT_542443 [Aspergillus sclerotioniger CBS 115572]|uniref:Uncharacterized protein n=1 Tax=Aspergillus sclerotioniger CBS 115572 TaxID=1450535 RepID=A0A317X9D9_9EURO|nr:hypothetical protein BO94DRAFT_542443 [Aspergillus sclerotioniger CBS 115572]PWY95186.1 hypothetical protein BO94DRAFT_542443 [Aspergillus sclerotioniger CBS 115572]